MFVFALVTVDGTTLGLIERTCMGFLLGSSGRYINNKLDGSLDGIS